MTQWQLVDGVSAVNDLLFRNGKNTYFIYPVVLVLGAVLSVTIPPDLFRNLKTLYLLNDNNPWNKLFANQGDPVFSLIYLLFVICKLSEFSLGSKYQTIQGSIEEFENDNGVESSKRSKVLKVLRGFMLRFLLLQGILAVFLLIRYLVLKATSLDYSNMTGFRISGHFIFLTTVGLGTVLEFGHSLSDTQLFNNMRMEPSNTKLLSIFYFYTLTMFLALLTVVIWILCLLITTIFYHNFFEKAIGLLFGMAAPSVTYFIMVPRFEWFR